MSEIKWEGISQNRSGYMARAKVPGGWLYRISEDRPVEREGRLEYGFSWHTSICFVPGNRLEEIE